MPIGPKQAEPVGYQEALVIWINRHADAMREIHRLQAEVERLEQELAEAKDRPQAE